MYMQFCRGHQLSTWSCLLQSAILRWDSMQDTVIGMVAGLVFIAYVYFGMYWWYTTVAWRSLRTVSYAKNK